MPLGCGGRVQGARQDLVQVDLHCWYNKTNQASLYNGCDFSRGSKTNSSPHAQYNIQPIYHILRLPIVDVRVKDIGKSRQAFKVEVGRVCFSWSKIVFFLFQAKFTFNWNSSSTNFPSSWISAVAWFLFNLSHGSPCGISPIKDHFGAAEMISFYSTFSPFLPKHKRGDY